jgi:hypothetical protein
MGEKPKPVSGDTFQRNALQRADTVAAAMGQRDEAGADIDPVTRITGRDPTELTSPNRIRRN